MRQRYIGTYRSTRWPLATPECRRHDCAAHEGWSGARKNHWPPRSSRGYADGVPRSALGFRAPEKRDFYVPARAARASLHRLASSPSFSCLLLGRRPDVTLRCTESAHSSARAYVASHGVGAFVEAARPALAVITDFPARSTPGVQHQQNPLQHSKQRPAQRLLLRVVRPDRVRRRRRRRTAPSLPVVPAVPARSRPRRRRLR